MFNNKLELLDKIRLGEDSFLEFKEARFAGSSVSEPRRDSLADEIAAFANSWGGVVIVGVEDRTRKILGVPEHQLDVLERYIHEVCCDSITPPVAPAIEKLTLPASGGYQVAIIRIDVERSIFVHQSPGGYLHRVGSAKRVMSPDYLARLFQQRSQTRIIRFDEQIVSSADMCELDDELCSRFRTTRTTDESVAFAEKLGMARKDEEGNLKPTVAGVLMSSIDATRWLPNAYVQAVAYRGTSIRARGPEDPYQLDAADIFGPLDKQVVDACAFVQKNQRVAAFKDQGRRDLPQFDMTAVFEAVVNAVAHRDYSIYGSKIRLRLFEDRLELYSPGSLPNTLGIGSIEHLQFSRNEILTSLLAKCPVSDRTWLNTDRTYLMDKRGEGVPIILSNSIRLSGREPEYRLIGDAELLLTIYAASI